MRRHQLVRIKVFCLKICQTINQGFGSVNLLRQGSDCIGLLPHLQLFFLLHEFKKMLFPCHLLFPHQLNEALLTFREPARFIGALPDVLRHLRPKRHRQIQFGILTGAISAHQHQIPVLQIK